MEALVKSTLVLADTWDMHDGGWWVVMMIGMLLFWGLVILGIVWLVRELGGSRSSDGRSGGNATEILDRRLAEGDISVEEYEKRRALLSHGRQPNSAANP